MSIQVNKSGTLKTIAALSNAFVDLLGEGNGMYANGNIISGYKIARYTCPFTPSIVIYIGYRCKTLGGNSDDTTLPACRILQGGSVRPGASSEYFGGASTISLTNDQLVFESSSSSYKPAGIIIGTA